MSVYERIEEMLDRLTQGERSHITNRIKIYSEGVKEKLKNAEYALWKINELSSQSDYITTSEPQDFNVEEKIQFYVDSFFAFLYSTFDIISHVINQKYGLDLEEKKVSFNKVMQCLNQHHTNTDIQKIFDKLSRKYFFRQLDKYRNCSTHRRQICIETRIRSRTRAYSTTGDVPEVCRALCDNPLSLTPAFNRNWILDEYCKEILDKVRSEIINISVKI